MSHEPGPLQTPLYKLPSNTANPSTILWRYIAMGIVLISAAFFISTQYLAYRLGYQRVLGEPLFTLGLLKIYGPFDGAIWYGRYSSLRHPGVSPYLSQALWFTAICITASISYVLYRVQQTLSELDKGGESLHGSAHWASGKEVKATGLLNAGSGVYIGAWKDPKHGDINYLRHDGPEHVMAFAPTRSGKGVGLVLPTLLSWPHSALIYDIKGENWALTAGWRQQEAGNKVLKFEPTGMDGSGVRFNPLNQVRIGTDREVADAQNIMTMIVDPEGKGLQDHWQKTSQALLVGTLLHVLYSEPNKTLSGIVDFLTDPARTIQATLEHMLTTPHDILGERDWVNTENRHTYTHPVVATVARDMLNKAEEEMSSVLSSAVSYLTLYRDPIVARNTAYSDFKIDDLMNHDAPVSLYLVVPPSDKDRIKPLIRLVVTQIMRALTEKMEFKDGRSVASYKHRLLLLIDEFPSLGKLEVFEEALAFIAGYGLKAYLIIQDISQLWTAYGKDESIFSNCHVRIAYAPNKVETAELLSKMAGTATIVKQSHSYSGSKLGGLSNVSASRQETQRPLLTPDEVMRLPAAQKDVKGNVVEAGDMLIFMAGHAPIYGKQILYFLDPVFSARSKIAAPASSDRLHDEKV